MRVNRLSWRYTGRTLVGRPLSLERFFLITSARLRMMRLLKEVALKGMGGDLFRVTRVVLERGMALKMKKWIWMWLLPALGLVPVMGKAHDANGRFALKGAGMVNCQHFVHQLEDRSKEFYAFAGWIEGYLTGVNAYQKETFDIAPWQNTKVLALMVANYCKQHPKEAFALAVRKLTRALMPYRLKERSSLVVARNGDQAMRVYGAVVRQIQETLRKEGLYKGRVTGNYDEATRNAVLAYQKKMDLKQTGLPDAPTLIRLFGLTKNEKKS